MLKRVFPSVFLSCLLLSGCATTTNNKNQSTLDQLKSLKGEVAVKEKNQHTNSIRRTAIKETALSLGAQTALAWQGLRINNVLKNKSSDLDQIFNFNGLMLPHNVLPPVLSQGNTTLNLDGNTVLRISDQVYKIEAQARFVTVPPTWRDYLWQNYTKPDMPDKTLLPKNQDEEKAWKKYIDQGWQMGLQQSSDNFSANVGRLIRDFRGIILYRVLFAKHMVSAPYVAKTDLGVTGGDSEMNINDKVLRITALPKLQANSKEWQPMLRKSDG